MISNTVIRNIFSNAIKCRVQNATCRSIGTRPYKWRTRPQPAKTQSITEESASAELSKKMDKDAPVEMDNPFVKEKPKCLLCRLNIEPNYKNARLLSQFQSRYTGRIYEKHITGLCTQKQEAVEREIRKAQAAGFMGVFTRDVKYAYDPPLFSLTNPFRPHKY